MYNVALDCLDHKAYSPKLKNKAAVLLVDSQLQVSSITFSQLKIFTDKAAIFLNQQNLKKGDRVVIQLPNGLDFLIAFFGAMKMGAIPIPASQLLTPDEISFMVQDSGAKMVINQQNKIDYQQNNLSLSATISLNTSPDDPAYWLYTSGTSDQPKAVIHAHRSIPAHDERVKLWQQVLPDDIVFNTSSLNWSYSLTCAVMDMWRHGITTVIYSGELKAEKIFQVIQKTKATIFMSVPGIYRRLGRVGNIRVCTSAGEQLPTEIRNQFKKLTGLDIYEGLGMTEHSVYLVQQKGDPFKEGSCGKPTPSNRIAILREDGSEAEVGEVGILASHQSCPGLMLGIKGKWFLSGDLAYKDEEGYFYYVGRSDDVITAGGYRISPLEVESILNKHPDVKESAVIEKRIEEGKTIVKALIVLHQSVEPEKIIEFSKQYLASYKVPREIVFVEHLPKTVNEKIKRRGIKSNSE